MSELQAVPGPQGDGGLQIVQAHLQRCLERRRKKVRCEQMFVIAFANEHFLMAEFETSYYKIPNISD